MNPPRYTDLQVNGYGGVDFNQDELSGEDLRRACERLRADGVAAALATIISEDLERMCRRLARIAELRERDPAIAQVIAGLHIEGPFLNEGEGYRGAHPRDALAPADPDAMERLLEAGGGLVRLVTLAPERDPGLRVTRLLRRAGAIVAAGHCDPSLEQLDAAIDAGLTMFTHLGNGCPLQLQRHENIIQRALARSQQLWLCFIADGVHVPFHVLANYLRCAGLERSIVVTDAIAPAGLGPGRYTLGRWTIEIGPEGAARAPGGEHLIGSAITMRRAEHNLVHHIGLSAEQAHLLVAANPARALAGG